MPWHFRPLRTAAGRGEARAGGRGAWDKAHLDAVLEAVELPAGVTDLDPGLADVDRDALTLKWIA